LRTDQRAATGRQRRFGLSPTTACDPRGERTVRIPAGYSLEVLVDDLGDPRLLTFAKNDDLFVGSRFGNVYRLPPPYTQAALLVTLDEYPHSVAFRNGEILIAQTHGLYRAPYRLG